MRYITIQPDTTPGGSTLEDLVGVGTDPTWPSIAGLVPANNNTNVDPQINRINRDDDVTGFGASQAPETLSSAPQVTAGFRAFPALTHKVLRDILKGTSAASGTAPAAITSTVEATQSGDERCSVVTVVREGQVDRVSGVAWNEIQLDLPIDGDAQVTATGFGLYHDVLTEDEAALTPPTDQPTGWVYKLRDVEAYLGPDTGTLIDCLSGAQFTFTANLSTDAADRFCSGKNVERTVVGSDEFRVWYPTYHVRKGKRAVTCQLSFRNTRPSQELALILSRADKLRLEIAGEPLGTTPAADRRLGLILHKVVPTDGGAGELNANDSQRSQYTYGVYLDPDTSRDVQMEVVGTAAIT